MLTRKAIFSLIAVATVGVAAAFATSVAEARPGGPGAKGGGGGGIYRHVGAGRLTLRPIRVSLRRPILIRPHWCWHHPWRCRRPIHVVRYPIMVGAAGVGIAALSRPAASCTCLTKQHLPDGSVLFKDVCTQETAIIPAAEQQASAK